VLRYGTPSRAVPSASKNTITVSPSAYMSRTVGRSGLAICALNGRITLLS
jgi:hypothetical protein